jgi:hypothetical protein
VELLAEALMTRAGLLTAPGAAAAAGGAARAEQLLREAAELVPEDPDVLGALAQARPEPTSSPIAFS